MFLSIGEEFINGLQDLDVALVANLFYDNPIVSFTLIS